jgi:hypothetical protein
MDEDLLFIDREYLPYILVHIRRLRRTGRTTRTTRTMRTRTTRTTRMTRTRKRMRIWIRTRTRREYAQRKYARNFSAKWERDGGG